MDSLGVRPQTKTYINSTATFLTLGELNDASMQTHAWSRGGCGKNTRYCEDTVGVGLELDELSFHIAACFERTKTKKERGICPFANSVHAACSDYFI